MFDQNSRVTLFRCFLFAHKYFLAVPVSKYTRRTESMCRPLSRGGFEIWPGKIHFYADLIFDELLRIYCVCSRSCTMVGGHYLGCTIQNLIPVVERQLFDRFCAVTIRPTLAPQSLHGSPDRHNMVRAYFDVLPTNFLGCSLDANGNFLPQLALQKSRLGCKNQPPHHPAQLTEKPKTFPPFQWRP